jgi:RNA polymerase sigma-B factor
VRRTTEDLTQRLGRSPTVAELATELGESVDHVLEAMEAGVAHKGASLDQSAGGADAGEQAPALGDRVLVHHEHRYGDVDLRLLVSDLLAGLDERDRRIIEMRFFENRTQEEIAAELGMSQSYLSRVLRGLLLQLRDHLGDDPDVLAM